MYTITIIILCQPAGISLPITKQSYIMCAGETVSLSVGVCSHKSESEPLDFDGSQHAGPESPYCGFPAR